MRNKKVLRRQPKQDILKLTKRTETALGKYCADELEHLNHCLKQRGDKKTATTF